MKEKLAPNTTEAPETGDKWRAALRELSTEEQNFKLQLTVSGGMPAKAYHFFFSIEKNGRMQCQYNSKLGKRKYEKSDRATDSDIEQLVQLLLKTRIFDFQQPPPRFVPDTVVGKLEIYIVNLYHVQYFAADDKQGSYQQMPTHAELPKVVDWIYGKAARVLDKKNIKP